ncbi:MAG: ABC transporter substrate-binding protein [Sphingomonadales bacterium]|nr:ABC transporter substrate-binding protein [Sphingomonadales bacterium]MBU3991020.1 ABC transporter substrate-binding protein [Alphaproteobacteria bacterium]
MQISARAFRVILPLGLMAGLGACSGGSAPTVDIDVIGAESAPFETGIRLSEAGRLVRAATAEGLVALDEQGRVIPAFADRWIVTDDGLSYIFRLRDGSWPDGTEISGESARQALRQALAALRGTPLALEFAGINEIRAMAGRVVEIRLSRPAPELLQLLAQPELGLLRKGKGGGPMTLKREGPLALLTPIPPEQLGLPQAPDWAEQARSIRLHAVPANVAVKRFGDGDVDVVLGGRFETYPLGEAAAGLSRRSLRVDPAPGLLGLAFVAATGPLAAPETREALAMAIDREGLASALGVGGWQPTTRLVGIGSAGDAGTIGERWTDLAPAGRRTQAAARIARWKAQHGPVPALRMTLPEGPGADILFVRLAADFAGIGVPLHRVKEGEKVDLRLIDLVARFARQDWYLNQLSCAAGRSLCSKAADARLAEARAADDPARQSALLAEAEAELTAANVYIPLGPPVRWSLARERATGFAINPLAFHPLPPLALRPR